MQLKFIVRAVNGALLSLGLATAAHAQQQPFSNMVVFGDSLSDGGAYTNFIRSLGIPGSNQVKYFQFTTNPGNVWVEDIAQQFGLTLTPNLITGGTNYAEGGSRVDLPSAGANPYTPEIPVSQQINQYIATYHSFGPNTLVTILAGANDIFQGGAAGIPPAVTGLVTEIATLQGYGARNLVVVNLPDIGLTPEFRAMGPAGSALGTAAAEGFNMGLKEGLGQIGGNVLYIDAFSLFHEIIADPARYGITNTTGVACPTVAASPGAIGCTPATEIPGSAMTYLFADGVHPTTIGHEILADAVISELLAPGQISMLPLAAAGAARGQQAQYDYRLYSTGAHAVATAEFFGGAGYTPYTVSSDNQRNGIDAKNADAYIGVDYQTSASGGVGVVVSYSGGDTDFGNNTGKFNTDLTSLGIYGRGSYGPLYTFINGTYGAFDLDSIDRDIALGPATRVESGTTSGTYISLKGGGGYDFQLAGMALGPIAYLTYERTSVSGYSEAGTDSTELSFASQRLSQLTGSVGVQVHFADMGSLVQPYVRLTYDCDLTHSDRTVQERNQAMPGYFEEDAYLPGRDSATLVGGAVFKLAKNLDLTFNASTTQGQSDVHSYGVGVGLKAAF
jgi:outer membrane lipase/esterase